MEKASRAASLVVVTALQLGGVEGGGRPWKRRCLGTWSGVSSEQIEREHWTAPANPCVYVCVSWGQQHSYMAEHTVACKPVHISQLTRPAPASTSPRPALSNGLKERRLPDGCQDENSEPRRQSNPSETEQNSKTEQSVDRAESHRTELWERICPFSVWRRREISAVALEDLDRTRLDSIRCHQQLLFCFGLLFFLLSFHSSSIPLLPNLSSIWHPSCLKLFPSIWSSCYFSSFSDRSHRNKATVS